MLASTTQKIARPDPWDDELEALSRPPLTRDEARALVAAHPGVSPWRVVAMQAGLGLAAALLAMLMTGQGAVFWSALYGAGVVVLPGALMARGMTSRMSRLSPGTSVAAVLVWEMVKVGAAVAMLAGASRVVQPLSWPALLIGLVAGTLGYWFALLWRGRTKS